MDPWWSYIHKINQYDYQSKLDEEREIYDQERDSTDEKFRALEMKIKGERLQVIDGDS